MTYESDIELGDIIFIKLPAFMINKYWNRRVHVRVVEIKFNYKGNIYYTLEDKQGKRYSASKTYVDKNIIK